MKRVSIGKDAAIALAKTRWWEGMDPRLVCAFQFAVEELCMDFSEFHAATEEVLGRPVWTHEFGMNQQGLIDELFGGKSPGMTEIIEMIPEEKRVIILSTDVP